MAALPSAGQDEEIVVPEASSIRTLADLTGKRIGFAKGSSAHNTTVAGLEKAGLNYSDISPIYLPPAHAANAFAGGSLDAWTIWDPYLALVEKGKVQVIASAKDVHESNAFFLANRTLVERNPSFVSLLNQTFANELKWAGEHRAEIVASRNEATKFDEEAPRRAVSRSTFQVTPVTDAIVASQHKTADRFLGLGLIPKTYRHQRHLKVDARLVTASRQDPNARASSPVVLRNLSRHARPAGMTRPLPQQRQRTSSYFSDRLDTPSAVTQFIRRRIGTRTGRK